MTKFKFGALIMSAILILSSCGASNALKGGFIGGGGGAALGSLAGYLIGKNGKSTAIGAAVGTAVGATAGALIGNKMDRAKAKAEAIANAQVEAAKDANGLDAVKVTFDSGILFGTGSSDLSSTAQASLKKFADDVLKQFPDCDVAIQGYTDNVGWKNSTPEQSAQKNLDLSATRAEAVQSYFLSQAVPATQIKACDGFGEQNPVADNATKEGQAQNRRVEIYLYASQAMIDAANAGTLK